jgi:hypothetical protein
MDEAALKSYAALLLHVRGQTEAALALHRRLLCRKPKEASREVLVLARRCSEEGFPQRAQGLLQAVLDTGVCNASHPEAAWQLATQLMAQSDFDNATRLYVQAFRAGHGSPDDLYLVAQQLRAAYATASARGGREEGAGVEVADHADSANARVGAIGLGLKGGGDVGCLQHAQNLYELVLESDAAHTHAECALHLASVTYALLLHQEEREARAAATIPFGVHSATDARPIPYKSANGHIGQRQIAAASGGEGTRCGSSEDAAGRGRQRAVEGPWGQVVARLRYALECGGREHRMFERVFAFGVQLVEEGRAGDGATVLALVVELSQYSHAPAILKCANVLHHELGDLVCTFSKLFSVVA